MWQQFFTNLARFSLTASTYTNIQEKYATQASHYFNTSCNIE